jgi:hypothetical protein
MRLLSESKSIKFSLYRCNAARATQQQRDGRDG